MQRRITKINKALNCFDCGQAIDYPAPHWVASPRLGTRPEVYCSTDCVAKSHKDNKFKRGQVAINAGSK